MRMSNWSHTFRDSLKYLFPVIFVPIDIENPEIFVMPADMMVEAHLGSYTANVSWPEPTSTDNSDYVTLSSTHKPGDNFPMGDTQVIYTAVDPSGNEAVQSFTVTVYGRCLFIHFGCNVKNAHSAFDTSCTSRSTYPR